MLGTSNRQSNLKFILFLLAGLGLFAQGPALNSTPVRAGQGPHMTLAAAKHAPPICENNSYRPPRNGPQYRVVISPTPSREVPFPSPATSWKVRYKFTVPPLPCSPNWNYHNQVFYIWGDLDFDDYGFKGPYRLSKYTFNQIVPQLMIGRALSGNTKSYRPTTSNLSTWFIQAQYYWMRSDKTSFALTGAMVPVAPGDELVTVIAYDAKSGAIRASIGAPGGISSIAINRPFPNETRPPFENWKDFFLRAAAKSTQLLIRPVANVESHHVTVQTFCSVLPLHFQQISAPRVDASDYKVSRFGSYQCPTSLAVLPRERRKLD